MIWVVPLTTLLVIATEAQATPYVRNDSCSAVTFFKRASYSSYAALGDSYAVGLGSIRRLEACNGSSHDSTSIECTLPGCDKDIGSYAYLFAVEHVDNANFEYLACSGANSSDVAAQINSTSYQAPELITVQVGGDDFHSFYNIMRDCVGFALDPNCTTSINTAFFYLPQILQNVNTTLRAVNARAPSILTTRVLLGYVQFFGANYGDNCTVFVMPVRGDWRQRINALIVHANEGLSRVAAANGFLFVTPDMAYAGHRWCESEQPWWVANAYQKQSVDTGGQNYTEVILGHPSVKGQQAYLAALETALQL